MRKNIYSSTGNRLLRFEERNPKHNEDFCEACGSCLHCDGSRACFVDENGEEYEHEWIEYEEERFPDRFERNTRQERRKEKSWQ